jgi:hypothetical protein
MNSQIRRGVAAGIVGTGAVQLLDRLERRALGYPPVFAPAQLAAGLSRAWRGRPLDRTQSARAGLWMRWLYGPAWGALYGMVRPRWRTTNVKAGVGFGAAVALFELAALPAARATPPLRTWDKRELAMLGAQTLAFGLVTAASFARRLRRLAT